MLEILSFAELGLKPAILKTLSGLGYETPSPVQAQSIPFLLDGQDLIAQAQTGTGKTAAFALPILQRLNLKKPHPQALILAPTRELAIQVSEAFQGYAKDMPGFQVVPIYGGQNYKQQLRTLHRGVHVVVGTPGRVMDHMRRGTLGLDHLRTLVLDEADEMLKMGFIDDVKWILEQIPHEHQSALFSATMPDKIRDVAKTHLQDPQHVKVKAKTMTAKGITQTAMIVSRKNKLEALTRYLEMEDHDAVIIFGRTRQITAELSERLAARGYLVSPLNGDMNQSAREKVIARLKKKALDVIVATDVAARGLDVERISHVVNYDSPYDAEVYVHRIGRTGRAGRDGKSLLMMTPREEHHLRNIERTTKQKIEMILPPTIKSLNATRTERFMSRLSEVLQDNHLDYYRELIESVVHDTECSELDVAAALLKIAQKDKPLGREADDRPLLDDNDPESAPKKSRRKPRRSGGGDRKRSGEAGKKRSGSKGKKRASNKDGKRTSAKGGKKKAGTKKPKKDKKRAKGKPKKTKRSK